MRLFKPFFGLLLLVVIVSGCKEEEMTGKVKVTFTNHPDDLRVYIMPAENPQISITDLLQPSSKGTLTYNLNIGNYILGTSSATTYSDVAFQIKAGKTTVLYFDPSNVGHHQ